MARVAATSTGGVGVGVGAAILVSLGLAYFFCERRFNSSNKKKQNKKSSRKGLVDAIGNTPLIRINSLSDATGCEILGKCEFLNPRGSVKDCVAVKIIEEALESGQLRPGGIVMEGYRPEIWEQTNGNLDAFVAAASTGGTLAGVSSFLQVSFEERWALPWEFLCNELCWGN